MKRFWDKVDIKSEDECWNWKGAISSGGYGGFRVDYHTVKSNRFAWKCTYGEIKGKLMVLHKCNNKLCCNPNHLYLGTAVDNMRDRSKDDPDFHSRQDWSWRKSKFYEGEVWLMKKLKEEGCTYWKIAKMFKCGKTTIWKICTGKRQNFKPNPIT